MDFAYSDDLRALRDTVRRFVDDVVRPRTQEIERDDRIPDDVLDAAREIGLYGVAIPAEFGGLGLGALERAAVHEMLGRGPFGLASFFSVHTGIGCVALAKFGSDEQKRRYLPDMAVGKKIAAFALTESEAGSDAGALKTTAVRDGGGWVLNGRKIFITNAPIADVFTVFARTGKEPGAAGVSTFLVEKGTPGLAIGQKFDTIGHRGSQISEVLFDDCRVPAANLLGREGEGFKNAFSALSVGRTLIGARCCGAAQRALELSVDYAKTRRTFGKPLFDHQHLQFKMAEMNARVDAVRLAVYRSAWRIDRGLDAIRASSTAKYLGAEVGWEVVDTAMQIFGGVGYVKGESEIERIWRDLRVTRVYDGSSEIQLHVIAGQLGKGQLEYTESL